MEQATGAYAEIKHVRNVCPRCGATAIYRLRYKYPDEGSRICNVCQNEDKRESERNQEYEARLQQLSDDIDELKKRGLL